MECRVDSARNRMEYHIRKSFILIQFVLYLSFLYIDICGNGSYMLSNSLKYTGIVLCFLLTVVLYKECIDIIDRNLLRGALFFTAVSDLFILLLNMYTMGVITFCIVQFLYLIRLFRWKKNSGRNVKIIMPIMRNCMVVVLILIILIIFDTDINGLVILSILYFTGVLFNAVDAGMIAFRTKKRKMILFSVGMILFLLCDINVGFFNLSDYIIIHGSWFAKIYHFSAIAMWLFYLPAQALIALSGEHCYNSQITS